MFNHLEDIRNRRKRLTLSSSHRKGASGMGQCQKTTKGAKKCQETFRHFSIFFTQRRLLLQQFQTVTCIGSLPAKNLRKSRGTLQSTAEPRRTHGEAPPADASKNHSEWQIPSVTLGTLRNYKNRQEVFDTFRQYHPFQNHYTYGIIIFDCFRGLQLQLSGGFQIN